MYVGISVVEMARAPRVFPSVRQAHKKIVRQPTSDFERRNRVTESLFEKSSARSISREKISSRGERISSWGEKIPSRGEKISSRGEKK